LRYGPAAVDPIICDSSCSSFAMSAASRSFQINRSEDRLPEPFAHLDWLFEVKHNGFRAVVVIDRKSLLITPSRHEPNTTATSPVP
jgi:hypothetical protein